MSKDKIYKNIVKLDSLFNFALENPEKPIIKRGDPTMKRYRNCVRKTFSNVPSLPGWYMFYAHKEKYPYIYVGQSHKGKTSSVNARLKEHFGDGWVYFWIKLYGDHIAEEYKLNYPKYAHYMDKENKKIIKEVDFVFYYANEEFQNPDILKYVETELYYHFHPPANDEKALIKIHKEKNPDLLCDVIKWFNEATNQLSL